MFAQPAATLMAIASILFVTAPAQPVQSSPSAEYSVSISTGVPMDHNGEPITVSSEGGSLVNGI